MNIGSACTLIVLHVVINCALLLPPWYHRRADIANKAWNLAPEHQHMGLPLHSSTSPVLTGSSTELYFFPAVDLVKKELIPHDRKAQLKRLNSARGV